MSQHKPQLRSVFRSAAIALVGALAAVQTSSALTGTTVAYSFVGTCTDCSTETATLTLQNYPLGQKLNKSNLVSFTYNSNLISKTITPAGNPDLLVNGALPATLPGVSFKRVIIRNTGGVSGSWEFIADIDGSWCAGCANDTGTNGVWSLATPATPVVGTLALTSFGLILLILMGWVLARRSRGVQLS
jgi:hypothetical protein